MKHSLIVVSLVAIFILFSHSAIVSSPYGYDEADYMYAASQGFIANYTDTPTQSITEFVRIGLSRGRDRGARNMLSEYIRNSNDIDFYRHWHGPLYTYWLVAISGFSRTESATRFLGMLFPILGIVIVYVGTQRLFDSTSTATLAGAMYGWSHAVDRTVEIAPHQLFAVCSLASLLALAWIIKTGTKSYWYLAVIMAALAFCTLEVAFVHLAVLIIFAWEERALLHFDFSLTLRSLLVFCITVLVFHPASVLKLTFLKAYVFMAYLALFRKSPWGDVTLLHTWSRRFANAPLEWLLFAIALALFFFCSLSLNRRYSRPLIYFGGLMVVVTLRVLTLEPRYLLPFLPVLEVFAAWTIGALITQWPARLRVPAVALLCALMFTNTVFYVVRNPVTINIAARQLINTIRTQHLEAATIVLPQHELPMVHYYDPQASLEGYIDQQSFSEMLRSVDTAAIVYPDLTVALKRPLKSALVR